MKLPSLHIKSASSFQFLFYQTVFVMGDLVTWNYYLILLMRESNKSLEVVFFNQGILYPGLLLGLILGSYLLNKIGYRKCFQLGFILLLGTTILTFLTLPVILDAHLVMAFLRGFAKGFFYAASNVFTLREVHGFERSKLLSLATSINNLLLVVLPILVGAFIVNYGYALIFVVGIILYLLATLRPYQENLVPSGTFRPDELKAIGRRRGFKRMSFVLVLDQIICNQREMAVMVIPFIYFFSNEFDVGAFTSLIGLVAAFLAFTHRNDRIKEKVKQGFAGAHIISIGGVLFAIFWTLPVMVITDIAKQVGNSLFTPVSNILHSRTAELFLSNFTQESAVEWMLYQEILYFIARMINLVLFIVIFLVFKMDATSLLKLIIFISAFREVLYLLVEQRFLRLFKH